MRRSEEKQAELEELRAEVRRAEANLRAAHRDLKGQQVRAAWGHCCETMARHAGGGAHTRCGDALQSQSVVHSAP